MTITQISDPVDFQGTRRAQLERIEADLALIVGAQGSQALLARSRHLCGDREQSRALLMRNLLQLVRKLLGKQLAQWLLQSAASDPDGRPARARLS